MESESILDELNNDPIAIKNKYDKENEQVIIFKLVDSSLDDHRESHYSDDQRASHYSNDQRASDYSDENIMILKRSTQIADELKQILYSSPKGMCFTAVFK